jgi:hypothetical protein
LGGLRLDTRARVAVAALLGVLVFCVAFGIATAWHSLVDLPRTYQHLRGSGVSATARLLRCAPGIGGGRGIGCRLRLAFGERTHDFNYPEDSAQFEQLPPGAAVPVLVDAGDPTTAYTVRDVIAKTNAGWSAPAFFGAGLTAVGLLGLAWLAWFRVRMRRSRS